LTGAGSRWWTQASPGIDDPAVNRHDRFGAALAFGDFDADGDPELAVGTPNIFETSAASGMNGKVVVLEGTADGPTTDGSRVWPAVVGGNDDWSAEYGFALATGRFDGDATDDLAIGAPWADYRDGAGVVMYGGAGGLAEDATEIWTQDSVSVPGTSEPDDVFAISLAALDLDGTGIDELVVGVSTESSGDRDGGLGVGRVVVLPGRAGGIGRPGIRSWSQDTTGVLDHAEAWDRFGSTLAGSPARFGW
jgi:hypothetical protein